MYLGTDAIADRDLGFAIAFRAHPFAGMEMPTPRITHPQGNISDTQDAPSTIQQRLNKCAAQDESPISVFHSCESRKN